MAENNNLNFIQQTIDELLAKLRKELEVNLLNNGEIHSSQDILQQIRAVVTSYFFQDNFNLLSFFDHVNSAICVTNAQGEFVYVNQKFATIFGFTKSEILQMHFTSLLSKSQQPIVLEKYVQFFENRFIDDFETEGFTKSGKIVNLIISAQFYSNKQSAQFAISTITDITNEKHLNEDLITKNTIFDYSTELLSIIGYDGYFKLLSPSWFKKLGYAKEELLERPFIEFVYEADRKKTTEAKFTIIDGEEVLKFENRYVSKNGKIIWLSWNAQPVPQKNIMVAVARDITEEKQLKEALATKNLIVDFSLDMLCVAGFDGYYKLLNPAWQKTLGWTIEELKAKPFLDFVHPEDLEATKNVNEPL